MKYNDYHIHSTYSDGRFSVKEITNYCVKNHINCISITDHNTIDAYEDYKNYLDSNIKIIPGVELSSYYYVPIHILAYGFDVGSIRIRKLLSSYRQNKIYELVELFRKLRICEMNLSLNKLDDKQLTIDFLLNRLVYDGYFDSLSEAETFINSIYQKYKISKAIIPFEEIIKIMHEEQAITILAHPGRINKKIDIFEYILELKQRGLNGIEVYSPYNHNIDALKKFCDKNSLFITGGSDFHLSGSIGKYNVNTPIPYIDMENMKYEYK